jgi:hypothetical protein
MAAGSMPVVAITTGKPATIIVTDHLKRHRPHADNPWRLATTPTFPIVPQPGPRVQRRSELEHLATDGTLTVTAMELLASECRA